MSNETEPLPCPFCGGGLYAQWNRVNPKARCETDGCMGAKLPVLNLDQPDAIAAWNRRALPQADAIDTSPERVENQAGNVQMPEPHYGLGRYLGAAHTADAFAANQMREYAQAALAARDAEIAALKAENLKLEALCDATYVAQGADAYNHACEVLESWQEKRLTAGREPGCIGSLCGSMEWLYAKVVELEDAAMQAQAVKP